MTRQLPDVNVLVALLWPRLESHIEARAWFAKSGNTGWATNPLTQLGVLRLLTNPGIVQAAVSPADAVSALSKLTSHAGHEFWPLNRGMATSLQPFVSMIKGYKQWTDVVLLGQTVEHEGVLVTFDAGIKEFAGGKLAQYVHMLKSR